MPRHVGRGRCIAQSRRQRVCRPPGQRHRDGLQRPGACRVFVVQSLHLDAMQTALGQGAGLVDEQGLHPGQPLDRIQPPQQHAVPPHRPGRRKQCRRCRQRQRARAGDDQHRHHDPDRARGVDHAPHRAGHGSEQQHGPQERSRPAVGAGQHGRALGARGAHQGHDRFVARVGTDALHPHRHRRLQVHAAGGHGVAAGLGHRARLPGQHRLVGECRTLCQRAVGGERFADRRAQQVARAKLIRGDCFDAAVGPHAQRGLRQGLRGIFERDLGAVPGLHFEVAPAEQEADEHRQRIEIDLGAERASRVVSRAAAGDEGNADADGHRQVHADAPLPQRTPGACEEGRGREPHHRQRQQPAAPIEQALVVGGQLAGSAEVGRRGEHHDLHRAEGRDEQAPHRRAALVLSQRARCGCGVGSRLVSGRFDGLHEGRCARRRRVEAHRRALGGSAHLGTDHPGDSAERAFDRAGTGGAVHAGDTKRRLGDIGTLDLLVPARGRGPTDCGITHRCSGRIHDRVPIHNGARGASEASVRRRTHRQSRLGCVDVLRLRESPTAAAGRRRQARRWR